MMLTDELWEGIAPLLSGKKTDCGVTAKDNRLFLEAVLWINRTGAPWRDLPEVFGPWHTIYMRYNRWAHKGVWERILGIVAKAADVEFVHIDGTIVRVHQHGAAKKTSAKPKGKGVLAAA
jgi:transposase